MSLKTMAKVWEWSRAEGTELLVMLALADFCDDDGVCFPGIGRIAKKCRVSERTVQRAIEALEIRGEIVRNKGAGIRTASGPTNKFTLIARGDTMTPLANSRGDTGDAQGVTPKAKRGDTAMSPKPSEEPSGNTSGTKSKTCKFLIPLELHSLDGFERDFLAFIDSRKAIKKPLTDRAAELILRKLAERPGKALAALQTVIERGWRSFEWEWLERESGGAGAATTPRKAVNGAEHAKATAAAMGIGGR